jgi:hypothetical protein
MSLKSNTPVVIDISDSEESVHSAIESKMANKKRKIEAEDDSKSKEKKSKMVNRNKRRKIIEVVIDSDESLGESSSDPESELVLSERWSKVCVDIL